ncbi:MAG: ATP-binding protein [Gammaproteobacteria bacterium]
MADVDPFLARLSALLERIEPLLPDTGRAVDWDQSVAFRWRKRLHLAWLQPIRHASRLGLDDLQCIDRQKQELARNTRQFVHGLPANNALLWGSRGTGKSSLIKALLNEFSDQGLRLIEVERQDLVDLPDIVEQLYQRPERFIVYCDDLSFEANDPSYKALKVVLDGSVSTAPDNVLVYATSNRRHLMPEMLQENREARHIEGEIHPGETTEEKISLSERFGIWLSFYPFKQDDYLAIVRHWLNDLGVAADDRDDAPWRAEALRWALAHGSRSGRVAWQFARDWAGRTGLDE